MPNAVIVDAVRTPVGRRVGRLSGWHATDLAAQPLAALVARLGRVVANPQADREQCLCDMREDLGPVGTDDVDQVRFSVGFRGYRMDEVDDVLDRLGLEIGARDEQIRELREQLSGGPEAVASSTDDPDLPPAG